MTDDPQGLSTLLEHATAARDEALAEARRCADVAARQALQADQLHGYRREYEQRWQDSFRRGGSAQVVQCYRDFMARVEQALAAQQAQAEAQRLRSRGEQRATDETAARQARLRPLAFGLADPAV